jgi:hypothetical protein
MQPCLSVGLGLERDEHAHLRLIEQTQHALFDPQLLQPHAVLRVPFLV